MTEGVGTVALTVIYNALLPGFIGGSCLLFGLVVREALRRGWAPEVFFVALVIAPATIIWLLNIAPYLDPPWLAVVAGALLVGINFAVGYIFTTPPIRRRVAEFYGLACIVNAVWAVLIQIIALLMHWPR